MTQSYDHSVKRCGSPPLTKDDIKEIVRTHKLSRLELIRFTDLAHTDWEEFEEYTRSPLHEDAEETNVIPDLAARSTMRLMQKNEAAANPQTAARPRRRERTA